jgi:hypothetical protein
MVCPFQKSTLSLVTPKILQETTSALNPSVSLSEDAASYLSEIFNERMYEVVMDVYHVAKRRNSNVTKQLCLDSTINSTVKQSKMTCVENDTHINVCDVCQFLKVPVYTNFFFSTPKDMRVLGPIKRYSASQEMCEKTCVSNIVDMLNCSPCSSGFELKEL